MPAPHLRFLALTCIAASAVSVIGSATGPATATTAAVHSSHHVTHLAARPGLTRLLAEGSPSGRAILTLDDIASPALVSRLQATGLTVHAMHALPLAVVSGPVSRIADVVTQGEALDAYPDERLQYFDTASSNATSSSPAAAQALRRRGLTGKGVTVGVVDSGCDGTHPDLADHVQHNVIIYSPEYANAGTDPSAVIPVDAGPYNNSDIGSGHGTHVTGIIGADGTTGADHLGVAPDVKLDCFAIGEVIFTTAVVSAYDYILSQPHHLGIDVVNNSWGNSYRQFDPFDPVAVATKALAAKGVVIVFAAGNSGSGDVPMSLNPFSQSPWVISAAAGDDKRVKADFSSNGLFFDNSRPLPIGAGGHTRFTGDRIGLVHPDITAPGVDVMSSCDTLGTVVGPCDPDLQASASGTSMASPHIAGVAAVLLQAQPDLTPPQVRLAMQATATRVKTADGRHTAPGWQVGYGYVNLDKAVALVTGRHWARHLSTAAAKSDARVLGADDLEVTRSDFWQYTPPPVTLGGSDSHTYRAAIGKGLRAVQVTLSFPSGGAELISLFSYTVTVKDAAGKVVATTTTDPLAGSGAALTTLDMRRLKPGRYTFDISGDYASSDPDTLDSDSVLGRTVTLTVVQLKRG